VKARTATIENSVSHNRSASQSNPGSESARSAGLVQSAKSHRDETNAAIVAVFADVVVVKRLTTPQAIKLPSHGGNREPITAFTKKSRRNFQTRLAQCVNLENGIFATLTYPAIYPTDAAVFKAHLDTLLKRLRRLYPACGGFWRLEFQQRGAPHYHLLVFGVPGNVKRFRQWLALAWYNVVSSGDEKHLRAGVQCDRIQNRAHAMRYATKYSLKLSTQDAVGSYGRRWGQFGQLDQSPICSVFMSYNGLIAFKRLAVAWLMHRVNQAGQPMRSTQDFGKRLKAKSPRFGFRVFGLGDLSLVDRQPKSAGVGSVIRMLAASQSLTWAASAPLPYIERHKPRIEREARRQASSQWHKQWLDRIAAPIDV
jgi:hypothetical protein